MERARDVDERNWRGLGTAAKRKRMKRKNMKVKQRPIVKKFEMMKSRKAAVVRLRGFRGCLAAGLEAVGRRVCGQPAAPRRVENAMAVVGRDPLICLSIVLQWGLGVVVQDTTFLCRCYRDIIIVGSVFH